MVSIQFFDIYDRFLTFMPNQLFERIFQKFFCSFEFDLDSVCDNLCVDVSDLEPTAVSKLYDEDRH